MIEHDIPKEIRCENPHCQREASLTVYDRVAECTLMVCERCADLIVNRDRPEYHVTCPNCECHFGVN